MKASEIQIGSEYEAKVGSETIPVRILNEKASGGWGGINLTTKKKVFISLARMVLRPLAPAAPPEETPATTPENAPEAPKRERKPRTTKAADKRMSALDAAHRVLTESSEPLNAQQMIQQMSEKGYWTSPGGKTPHATLYSAILRELTTKGDNSRFVKTERGRFAAAASAVAQ